MITSNLQTKMKQVNVEIGMLHATLAHLETNVYDKANAGALDQQCLDIRRASHPSLRVRVNRLCGAPS